MLGTNEIAEPIPARDVGVQRRWCVNCQGLDEPSVCCSVCSVCSVLQCLQRVAVFAACCSVLQCVAMADPIPEPVPAKKCGCHKGRIVYVTWLACDMTRIVACICCSVEQCAAVCWNVLHCSLQRYMYLTWLAWDIITGRYGLQCVAVCRSLFTVCCSVLQCVAANCCMLQRVVLCCSMVQCVAVRCSALQCVAVRCSVLQCHYECGMTAVWCDKNRGIYLLQCVAVCCRVLQCVALLVAACGSAMLCVTWLTCDMTTDEQSPWSHIEACICRAMQCDAVWCSVMQCDAMWCNVLQVLQCFAMCCGVLQCQQL